MAGNSRIYVVGDNAYGSKMGNIAAGIKKVVDAHTRKSGDFTVEQVMPDMVTKLWVTPKGAEYIEEWKQNVALGVGEFKWDRDPGWVSKFLMGDIHEIDDAVGKP
jgi:hypothetical protein